MAENILTRIAASKRREVNAARLAVPADELAEAAARCHRVPLSMSEAILSGSGIIAEHKRRSPSRGEISPMSDVSEVARLYADAGASAMSVLTDTPFFGGSLVDLMVARMSAPLLPLLRKEFIVDEYQLLEARMAGADAVLLIASMLPADEIRRLNDFAHNLGLQTLVEIHSAQEIASIPEDADMVGINNRDLTSFHTDISNAARLIGMLPSSAVKIAESGLKTPSDMKSLRAAGFDGFLIGEAFMSAPEPGMALRSFIEYDG